MSTPSVGVRITVLDLVKYLLKSQSTHNDPIHAMLPFITIKITDITWDSMVFRASTVALFCGGQKKLLGSATRDLAELSSRAVNRTA